MNPETYQPQLIEETEALLGTPYFMQEGEYDIADYASNELGLKRFIYDAACRVLGTARHEDRQLEQSKQRSEPGATQPDTQAWNDAWGPTMRKITEIAFRYENPVDRLSRNLTLVNNATEYIHTHWQRVKERLFDDQQLYMQDIVSTLHKAPRMVQYVDELGEACAYDVQGTTIVAPTGFGKTRLIEICMEMFEPGQELRNNSRNTAPPRIVLVSPSIILLEQTAAELAEALPTVSVGMLYGDVKERDADVTLVTIDTFNSEFENNKLADRPVDVVMVDEAHHLSEPQFRKTFVTQWRGMSLVFTATPAYDLERDVRAIIPHTVEKTNILKSIEKGILNDGQIMSFFIDSEAYEMLLDRYNVTPTDPEKHAIIREVIDTLVLEFITPLLEEGRRGIIFCEQGQQAHWSNRLAERISDMQLSTGRSVRSESMHSYADNQVKVIEDFRNGDLDVITTVDSGREGLNADFDFVIINCNIVSRLRGHQIVGRGTRRSHTFPTTIYGQFSYRLAGGQHEKLYSIEEAFGSEIISQTKMLRDRHTTSKRSPRNPSQPIDLTQFPEVIKDLLDRIDRTPVGEAFVGVNRGRREVSPDLIPLTEIVEGFTVTEMLAKKILRAAGFQWHGRIEETDSRGRHLALYYSAEARDYLHSTLPKGVYLDIEETAELLQLPVAAVRQVVNDPSNTITGRPVSRGTPGRPPICYSDAERRQIHELARAIPGSNPGDRKLLDVAKTMGLAEETVLKLAGVTDTDRVQLGGARYLTAAEITQAHSAFAAIPMAGGGDMTVMRIAQRVGIDHQVVTRNMTDADLAAAELKRYVDARGFTRTAQVWPAETALKIAARMERFKARPLGADVIPSSILRKIVRNFGVTSSEAISAMLAEGGFVVQEQIITGTRSMSRCLSWQAVAYLEGRMGKNRGKNSITIDYDRLPTGPDDTDPQKIAYAQSMQALFLKRDQLRQYDVG